MSGGAKKSETRQPSAPNELVRRGLDKRARGGTEGAPQSLPPLAKASGNEAIGKTDGSRTSAQIADHTQIAESPTPSYACSTDNTKKAQHADQPLAAGAVRQPCWTPARLA